MERLKIGKFSAENHSSRRVSLKFLIMKFFIDSKNLFTTKIKIPLH
jgi:hypothetical protein